MSSRRDIQFTFNPHNKATVLDCSFIVDSTNGNGFGVRSLKHSGRVANVYMHTTATPAPGNPNPSGSPGTGSLVLGSSANFAILAYSAITGSTGAGSIVNGNMGIYPDTLSSVTNFPPSVDNGVIHAADAIANQAIIDATAAYTAGRALSATSISAVLDGQTLVPGVYKESTGTFSLAGTTNGTLTFNGPGTYIFQAASTLVTGAGGIPTMAFSGGATASNTFIYWLLGSSGTINSGVTSSGSIFYGTVIAQASVTATQPGTVDGRLFGLTGAVTLSNTNTINNPSSGGGGGAIIVILNDNYNVYLGGYSGFVSPLSGTQISISTGSSLTVGAPYVITSLGTTTQAQWVAAGLSIKVTAAVGVSFIAAATSGSGTGTVQAPLVGGSGIDHIEVIGDANLMNNQNAYQLGTTPVQEQPGRGMMFILQCYSNGVPTSPVNGTVIGLNFYLNNTAQGV